MAMELSWREKRAVAKAGKVTKKEKKEVKDLYLGKKEAKKRLKALDAEHQDKFNTVLTEKYRGQDAKKAKLVHKDRVKIDKKTSDVEKNMKKYEAWGSGDKKETQYIERYGMHGEKAKPKDTSKVKRGKKEEPDDKDKGSSSSYKAPSASQLLRSSKDPETGAGEVAKMQKDALATSKSSALSSTMITLQYENLTLMWPKSEVFKENIEERLCVKRPVLYLEGDPNTPITAQIDGTYPVSGDQIYIVKAKTVYDSSKDRYSFKGVKGGVMGQPSSTFMFKDDFTKKKKKSQELEEDSDFEDDRSIGGSSKGKKKLPTLEPAEERLVQFLMTSHLKRKRQFDAKGRVVPHRGETITLETFEFDRELRFVYTEYKGRKGEDIGQYKMAMTLTGRFKIDDGCRKLILKFDKEKKLSSKKKKVMTSEEIAEYERLFQLREERRALYTCLWVPGNGTVTGPEQDMIYK